MTCATSGEEVHRITTGAEAGSGALIRADLQTHRRAAAEPHRFESVHDGGLIGHGAFEEDHGLARSDAGDASECERGGEGVRAVVNLPTGDVHGVGADVGNFEPISPDRAVAAGPGSHFGNDERGRCRRFDNLICHAERVVDRGVWRSADGGVVRIDGDGVAGLRLEIEHDTRFEIQGTASDLEGGRIGSGEAQRVRAEAVVGHDDVTDLDRRSSADVLLKGIDCVVQHHGCRSCIRHCGRRIDPKLWELNAAASVFIHDVNEASAVHRDAFMLLICGAQWIADIGGDVQRAEDAAVRAVHIEDAGVFLADDEEVARLWLGGHRRNVGEGEHVRHISHTEQRGIKEVGRVHRGGGSIRGGASVEVHTGLEDTNRGLLLQDNEAAGLRIIRKTFRAGVVVKGADIDRLRRCTRERGACGIGELHETALALLTEDKLAAADVGDALGIVELGALRVSCIKVQRHRVHQLAGLRDLGNGAATIAANKERVGVPVVGDAGGLIAKQIVRSGAGWQRRAAILRQVVAGHADIGGEIH